LAGSATAAAITEAAIGAAAGTMAAAATRKK
jgi:hypothetical protein